MTHRRTLFAFAMIAIGLLARTDFAFAQAEAPSPDPATPGNKPAAQLPSRGAPPSTPEQNQLGHDLGHDVLPAPTMKSSFGVPEGLKTPSRRLFHDLGYGSEIAFPLTPVSCFDAGYKCYTLGRHEDSLAFVDHGLKQCNHARLYLLKSMLEIELGRPDDATKTLTNFRYAVSRPMETFGMQTAIERLNGPSRVRADMLLTGWQLTP